MEGAVKGGVGLHAKDVDNLNEHGVEELQAVCLAAQGQIRCPSRQRSERKGSKGLSSEQPERKDLKRQPRRTAPGNARHAD